MEMQNNLPESRTEIPDSLRQYFPEYKSVSLQAVLRNEQVISGGTIEVFLVTKDGSFLEKPCASIGVNCSDRKELDQKVYSIISSPEKLTHILKPHAEKMSKNLTDVIGFQQGS